MVEAIGTGIAVLAICAVFMVWTHRAVPGFMALKAPFGLGGFGAILTTMLDRADLLDGRGVTIVAIMGLAVCFASGTVLLVACMNVKSRKPR